MTIEYKICYNVLREKFFLDCQVHFLAGQARPTKPKVATLMRTSGNTVRKAR